MGHMYISTNAWGGGDGMELCRVRAAVSTVFLRVAATATATATMTAVPWKKTPGLSSPNKVSVGRPAKPMHAAAKSTRKGREREREGNICTKRLKDSVECPPAQGKKAGEQATRREALQRKGQTHRFIVRVKRLRTDSPAVVKQSKAKVTPAAPPLRLRLLP